MLRAVRARLARFLIRAPAAADDAVSDVLFAVARWQAAGAPLSLLLDKAWRTAAFSERQYYRKAGPRSKRHSPLPDDLPAKGCHVVADALAAEEALALLPKSLRVVVVEVRVNGVPRAAVAAACAKSLSWVDKTLARATRLMLPAAG